MLWMLKSGKSQLEKIFSPHILGKIRAPGSGLSAKMRSFFMIVAFVLAVVAVARPQIDHGEVKVKSSFVNVVVGFDISQSMFANDIYPNRFAFAKRKFDTFLKYLKNTKVALIGFSSRAFLIAPLTEDYNSLKFLTKNLGLEYLNLRGTSIMSALEAANNLFENQEKKVLVLFTDGGDESDLSEEIAYAKSHDITVFIYAIGTEKGGMVKTKNGVLKDEKGDIVIVRRNDAVKQLALETGGAYMVYSLKNDDIKSLAEIIESKFKAKMKEETTIKNREELFVYPLGAAMLFLFMAFFSLPQRRVS
jgi:Ca-activated chloride channel family protein